MNVKTVQKMRRKNWKKFLSVTLGVVFVFLGVCGCENGKKSTGDLGKIVVYTPDGAPAVALAQMMNEKSVIADKTMEYRVVSPSLIASKIANKDETKNADVCVLPVTAASKLVGDGTRYQAIGAVTNGNLYLISNQETVIEKFSGFEREDISCLIGKTVGVMKINEVPGLTFKSVLDGYGVAWQEIKNDGAIAEDKINLQAISDATAVDPLSDVACWLVAEPAASVQVSRNGFSIVADLTELYHDSNQTDAVFASAGGAVQFYAGYPQAVAIVKKSLAENEREWLSAFIDALKTSAYLPTVLDLGGEKIVQTVSAHLEDKAYSTMLKAEVLTRETLARCGIGFGENRLVKEGIMRYLQRIVAVNANAAKEVGEEFFYF